MLLVTCPLSPLLTVTDPPLALKLATNTLSLTISHPLGLAPTVSVPSQLETLLKWGRYQYTSISRSNTGLLEPFLKAVI